MQQAKAPTNPGVHARRKRVSESLRDTLAFEAPPGSSLLFWLGGNEYKVQYLPAESNTGMFGGNSNWRGPVWMPVNALIIRGLLQMYPFYGPDFKSSARPARELT